MPDFGEATRRQGFRGVTRKVSSNSKHTLLLPLFGSNRKAFGLLEGHLAVLLRAQEIRQQTDWNLYCYFSSQSIVSRCPSCQKKKGDEGGVQACALLRLQGTKPDFHPSEKQTIVSIRCRYMPITAKTDVRPIRKCYLGQIQPRLFTSEANQWFAKTMKNRTRQPRK